MQLSTLKTMTRRRLGLMQAIISAADGRTWICATAMTGILILRRPMLNADLWRTLLSPSGFCPIVHVHNRDNINQAPCKKTGRMFVLTTIQGLVIHGLA